MGHGQSTASGTKVLAKVAQGDARATQQVCALDTPTLSCSYTEKLYEFAGAWVTSDLTNLCCLPGSYFRNAYPAAVLLSG